MEKDYMKTNKEFIYNIINNNELIDDINNLVFRVNKIVIHSYQFLKLYLSHLYEQYKLFPIIDSKFIGFIFITLTIRTSNQGGYTDKNRPIMLTNLIEFYNLHYKSML